MQIMSKVYKQGYKQGKITFLYEFIKEHSWGKERLWMCRCDCGKEFHVRERAAKNRWACWSCTVSKNVHDRFLQKHKILNLALKKRVYREYKRDAIKRNLSFNLNLDEFINIVEQNCFYCGSVPQVYKQDIPYTSQHDGTWLRNGIDRIDSNKGYEMNNCVPCCAKCNYAKHTMTIEEYKKFIKQVYNHLFVESSTTIPKGSTSQVNGDGNGELPIKEDDIV